MKKTHKQKTQKVKELYTRAVAELPKHVVVSEVAEALGNGYNSTKNNNLAPAFDIPESKIDRAIKALENLVKGIEINDAEIVKS